MNGNELVGAAKYLYSRRHFREAARGEFFAASPYAMRFVETMNEYVAGVVLSMSGQNFAAVANPQYICDLMVSFTRTHFIVVDLIVCSELIEAATLLRKQFELLARLNELATAESLDELLERTPNLRALKTDLKRLYGEYSRISHSAHPEPLTLLGESVREDGHWTPVYPHFQKNAYVALQNAFVTTVEYHAWADPFLMTHLDAYDAEWGGAWLQGALQLHDAMAEEGGFR